MLSINVTREQRCMENVELHEGGGGTGLVKGVGWRVLVVGVICKTISVSFAHPLLYVGRAALAVAIVAVSVVVVVALVDGRD